MTCDYKTPKNIYAKKLNDKAILPTKNNAQDAGWDLYALEDIVVPSLFRRAWAFFTNYLNNLVSLNIFNDNDKTRLLEYTYATKVKTGIACELQPNTAGLIWDRSGMGSKLIKVFGGVIDCTYRGEIIVCLANFSFTDYNIKTGDRIAQLVIQEVCNTKMIEIEELSETFRGNAGFGSSGA